MSARIIRPLTGRIQVRGLRAPRGDEPANKTMFKNAAGAAIRPTWVDAAEGRQAGRANGSRAKGDDCTCACACDGRHHGEAQHASWLEVGETTLIRGEGRKVVHRVLLRDRAESDREGRLQEMVKAFVNRCEVIMFEVRGG